MKYIKFEGDEYPSFQAEGNAAKFILPFAKLYCKGNGYDIGCNREEWMLPGSYPIDPLINKYDAMNLPYPEADYIFSSHCLEHLDSIRETLEYWTSMLKVGGILFLYLPHKSQKYWHPRNCKKHKHSLNDKELIDILLDLNYKHVHGTGPDLNNSFVITGEKS